MLDECVLKTKTTMSSATNTPKTKFGTPRLSRRRQTQVPPETPDCYTKVTVETPRPARSKAQKDKCDEVRNLTVAIRIRPMNARELACVGACNVVRVDDQKVIVNTASAHSVQRADYIFPYDHVFWSCDETRSQHSNQEDVFLEIGQPLLHNAFRGYNACLFAYGQTGTGKSYSMMGTDIQHIDNAGIIPRFCQELFSRISQLDVTCTASVSVSYFEIYNEKIHDLLSNTAKDQHIPLKVREHKDLGPYVVNLSTHPVKSYEEMRSWLLLGNTSRATAATVMNEKSSRSHSIFSVELSVLEGTGNGDPCRRSKVSLVDLAGSERLNNLNSNDEKLKQSVSINKSLLTLGKVIGALADPKKANHCMPPYRESVLTWLLKESLGGNSLTCMLATITPSSTNLDETLATLRYACQARCIVNRARVNEEPHDRLIRELRLEVERLKALERNSLSSSSLQIIDNSSDYSHELEEFRKKLAEKEHELERARVGWEKRCREARQQQLQKLAEVEREKEELQSRVRIMSNLNEDIDLNPYHTNFLKVIEDILENDEPEGENCVERFKQWLSFNGFCYELESCDNATVLYVFDSKNNRKAKCCMDKVKVAVRSGEMKNFVNNLKWEDTEIQLTESKINATMNEIYDAIDLLRPYIEKEEKMRLAFAKFVKSAQVLESTLCNSIDVSKSKKAVTFRL